MTLFHLANAMHQPPIKAFSWSGGPLERVYQTLLSIVFSVLLIWLVIRILKSGPR